MRTRAILWDSGKVASDQSIQVRYAGKPLVSEQECFWKVRVWDEQGKASAWSEPARWSMGLLKPSDWHAKWIGLDEPAGSQAAKKVLGDAQWIWFPEGQPEKAAPVGTRYFRRAITLPADRTVKRATLFFTADNSGEFFVNGQKVGGGRQFSRRHGVRCDRALAAREESARGVGEERRDGPESGRPDCPAAG